MSAVRFRPWPFGRQPGRLRLLAIAGLIGVSLLGLGIAVFVARGRPGASPDELADEARSAILSGRWSRAEALLGRLSRLRTPRGPDLLLLAALEEHRGRTDAALAALARVPDADPWAARARLRAAQVERKRDRMRRAEALLLEAIRLDPKLIQARRELIFLYGMQARTEDLGAQFRALATLVPLTYDDALLWSASHEDIWINQAIQRDLERYVAADPGDRKSRLALAEVLVRSGKLDEAEATLRPLADSDVEALALRARIALDRPRLKEARSLLARGPDDDAGLALLRGRLALRLNDPAEAARQLRDAARLDPANREVFQALALALARAGEEDAEVRERLERLRTLGALLERSHTAEGHRDRSLPRRIAAASEAVGLTDQARAWYQVALGIDPLDSVAQHALYRLGERAGGNGSGASSGSPDDGGDQGRGAAIPAPSGKGGRGPTSGPRRSLARSAISDSRAGL